jgi:transposase
MFNFNNDITITMKNQSPKGHIGIDVAKEKLDVYYYEHNEYKTFQNNEKGRKLLVEWAKKIDPKIILCEATGGYQNPLIRALLNYELPCNVSNPARIRDYAKSCGILAKTDKIDAKIIAQFAAERKIKPQKKLPNALIELKELLAARRFFVGEKKRINAQREHVTLKMVVTQIKQQMKQIEKRIEKMENEIFRLIELEPELKKKFDILKTIPGIGNIVAATLIIECPEWENGKPEKICALAGVVPMNYESGKMRGRKKIKGGRGVLRTVLFNAAMVVVNRVKEDNIFKQLYKRLIEKGKAKMAALIAGVHKILRIAHFLVKKNCMWKNNLSA